VPAVETITVPLVRRHSGGDKQLIAACFRHPLGPLSFDSYWQLSTPRKAALLALQRQGHKFFIVAYMIKSCVFIFSISRKKLYQVRHRHRSLSLEPR